MSQDRPSQTRRERVLVVDDTKSVRDFLIEYVLKPQGFEVIVATNGLDGLKLAAAHEPDLMLVDNQMPQLTGLELLKTLRESGLEVPAILITGHGSEQIAVEAFRLGIRDYVIKPFEIDTIVGAIDRALRETRLARERDELTHKLVDSNLRLQRRVQELNTLYGIGKSVSSSLDLAEVLERVIEGAVYITSAEEGSLLLLDVASNQLYVGATKNVERSQAETSLPVEGSLAGEALSRQRPLHLDPDLPEHQAFLAANGIQTLLYVPVVAHGRPLGVLAVANRYRDIPFTEREARILSPLVDYAAIAISNAHLYAETIAEQRKLHAVLSQTDDPVLVLGESGQVLLANPAAQQTLGIPGESNGRSIRELIPDRDQLAFIAQPVPAGQATMQGEITTADGRVFNAHLTLIDGIGRSIVMRDISQLKELDRLKSELVSIVSHDLRSPLTSILGYIDLLPRAGHVNEQQAAFIKRIQNSVENITTLISDLLDLGRLEANVELTLAPQPLTDLLRQVLEEVGTAAYRKHQHVSVEIAELPPVMADRIRLHQAFGNLLNNAVKYTPEGGEIGVKAYEQEGQIVVQISDTGIGIPPSEQSKVFDKFYRADNVTDEHEGTGLGLSIVKSIIEKHQGRVWVQSLLGEGSTFFVVLPSQKQELRAPRRQRARKKSGAA